MIDMETQNETEQFDNKLLADISEPEFDAKRLKDDGGYRFDMVDQFKTYMDYIVSDEDRVRYFMRMCKAMGFGIPMLNIGGRSINNRPIHSSSIDLRSKFDEHGVEIQTKLWNLPGHTSYAVAKKLYVVEYAVNRPFFYLGIRVVPFDQRQEYFYNTIQTHPSPDSFKKHEFEQVCDDISKYQREVNKWVVDNIAQIPSSDVEFFKELSTSIYRELYGAYKAVDWANLTSKRVTIIRLLWDIVRYKVFLESNPTTPSKLDEELIARNDKKASPPQCIADIWLGEESEFWRIVKYYADAYTEEIDGKTKWSQIYGDISYLAGFIHECQKKGWIAKGRYSAPDFKRVLENTFSINFDNKPFKNANLNGIDPKYTKPFKSIPQRFK